MSNKEPWTTEKIPDLKGKIAIVTGSSSGLGYETARVIAGKNAKVIMAIRSLTNGELAKTKILEQNAGADIELMKLDLSNLKSVEQFTEEFNSKFNRLDVLINNAGVMVPPYSMTKDGFELQMGTNHLGHFALTLQLLSSMQKAAHSRIVNVSSQAHSFGKIDFDDLSWEKRKYKKWIAYGDSKIANLYFTNELGRRMVEMGSDIKVTAAHPGWTTTKLQRHSGISNLMVKLFSMRPEQGALSILRAAFDQEAKNGDFYGPDGFLEIKGYPIKVKMIKRAKDESIAKKLWEVSENLTKVKFA